MLISDALRRLGAVLAGSSIAVCAAQETYLTPLSPMRRIEVQEAPQPYPSPSTPFTLRAQSIAGTPVPNKTVFLGPGADTGYPIIFDEFGFRGFNTVGSVSYDAMGGGIGQYFATTDSSGVASVSGRYFDPAPSAFVVMAALTPLLPFNPGTWKMFSVVAVRNQPAGNPSVVLEYFNSTNGHYFVTISQAEIDALDEGRFSGWKRSIGAFIAYETEADAPAGTVPVCRFFSSKFTSHFYTADPGECDSVAKNLGDVWTLETRSAFYMYVPDKLTGECATGLQPVHRMFNNGNMPNHRYITDAKLRDIMVGAGWIAEGYGGNKAVMMCVPA